MVFLIPGTFSPEAMVALLSVLTGLEILSLGFQSLQSRPDWVSPSQPLPNRSIIPAIHQIRFKSNTEYFEELASRIDAPQLDDMGVESVNIRDGTIHRTSTTPFSFLLSPTTISYHHGAFRMLRHA
jgi:hypothetical protein